MTKTYDPTTCLDPQTMLMIHQAAHAAIHEGMHPQMHHQDPKQVLALDVIQHQPGFLNSRFKWTTYCARLIQRKLKQLRTAQQTSQRASSATDPHAKERARRGVWSNFERWINQEQELTQYLTSQALDPKQGVGPGHWCISKTVKQKEHWTTDTAGNQRQGTTQIETQQNWTWTPTPEKDRGWQPRPKRSQPPQPNPKSAQCHHATATCYPR